MSFNIDLLRNVKRNIFNIVSSRVNANSSPSWRNESNDVPWFDRPDAMDVIDRKMKNSEISSDQYQLLYKWVRDGYLVVDNLVDIQDIDQMIMTLDGLWTSETAISDLTLLGVKTSEESDVTSMTHEQILKLDEKTRLNMPSLSNWRIHEFWSKDQAAKKIFENRNISSLCDLIFGKPSYARSSINFMYGSAQEIHQDMAVFHIFPHNYLIGAWLACEDINPESGPLIFYPGSHRIPFYKGFKDYPQTQLRTLPQEECKVYYDYLKEQMVNFEKKEFIAKKGQILLWHGALVHGGASIKRQGITRKSFVIHYLTNGVDRTSEIKGPFNWQ